MLLRLIRLENFRCYKFFDSSIACNLAIDTHDNWRHLSGPNGIGKTSVLEAISLLSPGRGLRKAAPEALQHDLKNQELNNSKSTTQHLSHLNQTGPDRVLSQNYNTEQRFQSSENHYNWRACFEFPDRQLILSPGIHGRKISTSNGERNWHQDISVFWITPQSAVDFFTDKTERRRCIDKWITGTNPEYHAALLRYRKAYIQWLQSAKHYSDERLCAPFERILETEARIINAYRNSWQNNLHFTFGITKLKIEEANCEQNWTQARKIGVAQGPHRADVQLSCNGLSSDRASTGEQKLMLFGLVYTVAQMHRAQYKILLLDDWSENFDTKNRALIQNYMKNADWLEVWSSGIS